MNATKIRKTIPSSLRLLPRTMRRIGVGRNAIVLARDPDGRRGAPDRQAEEEVDDVDPDEGGADCTAARRADPGRPTRRVVAVVAVDQDDDDREDDDFRE